MLFRSNSPKRRCGDSGRRPGRLDEASRRWFGSAWRLRGIVTVGRSSPWPPTWPGALPAAERRRRTNGASSAGRSPTAYRRVGRRRLVRGLSMRSCTSGSTSGTLPSTATNLARLPRSPRLARYSAVRRADIFSATAELIRWLIEMPSLSATSPSRRWIDAGKRRLNALRFLINA